MDGSALAPTVALSMMPTLAPSTTTSRTAVDLLDCLAELIRGRTASSFFDSAGTSDTPSRALARQRRSGRLPGPVTLTIGHRSRVRLDRGGPRSPRAEITGSK